MPCSSTAPGACALGPLYNWGCLVTECFRWLSEKILFKHPLSFHLMVLICWNLEIWIKVRWQRQLWAVESVPEFRWTWVTPERARHKLLTRLTRMWQETLRGLSTKLLSWEMSDPRCYWVDILGASWWWYLESLTVGNEQKFQTGRQTPFLLFLETSLICSCLPFHTISHYSPLMHCTPVNNDFGTGQVGFCLRTFGLTVPGVPPSCVWLLFIFQVSSLILSPKSMFP